MVNVYSDKPLDDKDLVMHPPPNTAAEVPAEPPPPRLLDQLTALLQRQRYAPATIASYRAWVRHYILFHHVRHPQEMGAPEVAAFLDHLARGQKCSLPAQAAARKALVFLYRELLRQ